MKQFQTRTKHIIVLLLGVVLFTTYNPAVKAQAVSAAMMQMAQGELNKRGLTEAEVRVRLVQKGIDIDNIKPAEYQAYQGKITSVLNELEAEKKKPTTTPVVENDMTTEKDSTITKPTPKSTLEKAVTDASKRNIKSDETNRKNIIYGHSVFSDHSLDVFRSTDGAQAPDTYVLGEGDEIRITIFGASQTDIQQRISTAGSIQPAGLNKIFLKGLTLTQARAVIQDRLAKSYSFRADQLAVSIVTARTILVNVFGETHLTGGFTLSAINSALNALSAAGGPTDFGSVRNIQLIRGTTRKNIDLYEFMNDPAVQFRFDLQNNDILFVPMAKNLITIKGAVKRPMIYEMLEGETINDLIRFAGGLTKDVYPEFIQVQRYQNGEQKLFEWNLADIISSKTKIELFDGDVVSIKNIAKPLDQYVDIQGSVYYPGRFDLKSNSSLSLLLANAKPKYQAKTDMVFVERMHPDSTISLMHVPYINEQNGIQDFILQSRDRVRVLDKADYRDLDSISITGHVRKPFVKNFGVNDHITINQAIEYAGGLKQSVYPVAYIFRRNLFNPTEMKYIRVDLNKSGNLQLQPGDQLNIYDNTTYSNVGEIRISGAVKNPSSYTFDPSMSLHDLLTNAGGFNIGAAYNRIEVFRLTLSPTEQPKLENISLQVDSNYNLIKPTNFALQPYDQVVVRMTPEFTLGRTVELNGQVKYPGIYVLESKMTTLSDVIKMAGGLLNDADPYGATFFRTYRNRGDISVNLKQAIRHPNNYSYNLILFEGDVINIKRLENTVTIMQSGTRMAQYSITNLDSTAVKNVVFQGAKSAFWYINNFAGGFQQNADRRSVTATYPNNQMQSTKQFLFFRIYPTVQPGTMITLKMDPDKIAEDLKPKEKVDWEATISKGLATLMSTLSVILLLKSLNP